RARAGFGEFCVFRQETVARMYGLGAGCFRGGEDGFDVQVAFAGGGGADADGLVGHGDMQRGGVGIGIDGDGADAEPLGRAHNADGDFSAIGDEEAAKHSCDKQVQSDIYLFSAFSYPLPLPAIKSLSRLRYLPRHYGPESAARKGGAQRPNSFCQPNSSTPRMPPSTKRAIKHPAQPANLNRRGGVK